MKNLEELEKKYAELWRKIEALKSEYKYPIYCLSKSNGLVVKFLSLNEGVVVKQDSILNVGYKINDWDPHTDTDVWQQLDVCPDTGFYDGQLVWAWDEDVTHTTHTRILKFYNTKNTYTYPWMDWANYEPYEGDWPEWALEAFKTLEI